MMNKVKLGKVIIINKSWIHIRLWKKWYFSIWYHKPKFLSHLTRLGIDKMNYYLDDPDDKKVLGALKDELYMISDVADLISGVPIEDQ